MSTDECCTQNCDQGRKCPRRLKRRAGPSAFWRLLGWLLRERRGGFDRRARAEEPLAGGRARKELTDADDR